MKSVLTEEQDGQLEGLVSGLVENGAADIIKFRRQYLRENTTLSRSDFPFDEIASTVKKWFYPAWDESRLLSEHLDVSIGEILAYSGFSDFIDLLGVQFSGEIGCTAVAVSASSCCGNSEPLLAQTWDYKVFYRDRSLLLQRQPDDGLASIALTTSLGHAYMGINEAGVTVLINNLQSTDAQIGLPFSVAVHAVLSEANSAKAACSELERLPIMSTHNYLIGDRKHAYNIEAGGGVFEATKLETNQLPWVHTNHTLHDHLSTTITDYSDSSDQRYSRSLERLRGSDQNNGKEGTTNSNIQLPEFFVDHDTPLCRHGTEPSDTATIATVWSTLSPPTLHVIPGPPCEGAVKKEVGCQ